MTEQVFEHIPLMLDPNSNQYTTLLCKVLWLLVTFIHHCCGHYLPGKDFLSTGFMCGSAAVELHLKLKEQHSKVC